MWKENSWHFDIKPRFKNDLCHAFRNDLPVPTCFTQATEAPLSQTLGPEEDHLIRREHGWYEGTYLLRSVMPHIPIPCSCRKQRIYIYYIRPIYIFFFLWTFFPERFSDAGRQAFSSLLRFTFQPVVVHLNPSNHPNSACSGFQPWGNSCWFTSWFKAQ